MTLVTTPLLSYSVDNAIATLTLNHPPVNALTLELLTELESNFDSLAKSSSVKVVILTGTGRFFIAGADIADIAEAGHARQNQAEGDRAEQVADDNSCQCRRQGQLPCPEIRHHFLFPISLSFA